MKNQEDDLLRIGHNCFNIPYGAVNVNVSNVSNDLSLSSLCNKVVRTIHLQDEKLSKVLLVLKRVFN